jgi:hypothetical protein
MEDPFGEMIVAVRRLLGPSRPAATLEPSSFASQNRIEDRNRHNVIKVHWEIKFHPPRLTAFSAAGNFAVVRVVRAILHRPSLSALRRQGVLVSGCSCLYCSAYLV